MLLRLLSELISPSRCAACDALVSPIALFCTACAATVDAASGNAAFEYGGAIAVAITRLKYGERADLASRLGRAMVSSVPRGIEVIVPVPLHPKRLAERGYNQAALLGSALATSLAIPLAARAIVRVRDTPQQALLDRASRLVNLAGAFALQSARRVSGRRVLLVDDVRTTGATLHACIATLENAGPRELQTLVLARRE